MKHVSGLKLIAALEASKGMLAILVAYAVHELSAPLLQHWAEQIVQRLHLNPANHLGNELLSLSGGLTSHQINVVALAATGYGVIRFIEAFGLWRGYRWTEWFALLSGAIYVPFELYHLYTNFNGFGIAILLINLGIIAYMWRTIAMK